MMVPIASKNPDNTRVNSTTVAVIAPARVNPPNTSTYVACGLRNASGRITSGGFGFAEFLSALSVQTGRAVLDRTGLSGKWDLHVEYAPAPVPPGVAPDANRPDLFTALQEQLGLKLEATTGPVQVFVVDRLERPTPD